MPESPQAARFRLDDLVVDTATRQVWRGNSEIPLTGLSFDLLKALMDIGTRVVTTDELMDRVWPGRVVNAETVGKRVELVREALSDNSQEPRYIALVRGRGYRLLHAPQVEATPPATAPQAVPDAVVQEPKAAAIPRSRRVALIAGLAAALGLAVVFGILNRSPRAVPTPQAVAADEMPSVAVLPFLNLSEDAGNAYFSDGMAEELLGTLSKLPGLRVASRTSAFTFRGSKESLPEIAQQLNVDHIVEGSVRKAGNRIRVTIQLIEVRTDSHLWAETYDRELSDVLEIQREIAEKIAAALRLKFTSGARVAQGAGTRNPEAWQLYLRGHQLWQARSEESIRQGIGLLSRAIELDPGFAEAHASLAGAYLISFSWYSIQDAAALDRAREAAGRAIALDPTLSQPQAVLGELAYAHFDWTASESRFRHALKLNRNDAQAAYWLGEMLGNAGRTSEGLAIILEYEKLDPISPSMPIDIGILYKRLGDDARACDYFKRATEVGRSILAWLLLAECREKEGDLAGAEQAERAAQQLVKFDKPVFELVRRGQTDAVAAREARLAIQELVKRRRIQPARGWMKLGDYDAAFDSIEQQVLRHDITALRDLWWRDGAQMRAHPRFRPFVEKIGLVGYWRKSGWPDVCRPAGDSFTCD